jgi:histidinol-phosphatase (PHP family)
MNEPLDYTYHSHTKRCGHAIGEDEDYVRKAIAGGYQILGFSDHVMLPGRHQPGMRGDYALAPGYFSSVRGLAKQYEKQLRIYLAFEAEWYGAAYEEYYRGLLSTGQLDYLLLGQHCFLDGESIVFYGCLANHVEATIKYTNDLIEGMRSGLFAYVAHPDLFMAWHGDWDEVAKGCARKIIQEAKDLNMILEVNMGPSRWGRRSGADASVVLPYPYPAFWDLVAESGVRVIIGVDDHSPEELLNSPFDWVRAFVATRHLNYLNRLELPVKKG